MDTSLPLGFSDAAARWSAVLEVIVVAGLFLVSWPKEVKAQGYWCPPGTRPVPGGGGTMCLCPDGSYANIDGCTASPTAPRANPQVDAPPVEVSPGAATAQGFPSCGDQQVIDKEMEAVIDMYARQEAALPPDAPGKGSYVQNVRINGQMFERIDPAGFVVCKATVSFFTYKNGHHQGSFMSSLYFYAGYKDGQLVVWVPSN